MNEKRGTGLLLTFFRHVVQFDRRHLGGVYHRHSYGPNDSTVCLCGAESPGPYLDRFFVPPYPQGAFYRLARYRHA